MAGSVVAVSISLGLLAVLPAASLLRSLSRYAYVHTFANRQLLDKLANRSAAGGGALCRAPRHCIQSN